MSEEFKHLPYCKTCDIFSDDCGHEIVTFEQWSQNKPTGEKFVCAHGYKIRWYRGSLNEMGNIFSRRLDLTPELESRLAADNRYDTRLYEYWKQRLPAQIEEVTAEPVATD